MEENETVIAARRFLRTGSSGGMADTELAAACDRLVQDAFRASIRKALRIAERFSVRAEHSGRPILVQTASRSLGRMHHFSGSHQKALEYYLKARALCRAQPLIRARVDRTLVDICMYLGDTRAALRYGNAAIRTFSKLRAESDLAQTWVNLGNLYHRQDDPRRASRLYESAIHYFEKSENRVALARCYYNQANVLVQLFSMDEAEALYRLALQVYGEAGYELDAADARYGLAWLWLLTGRFHAALLELSLCESIYRKAGDPRGHALCLLDRADVHLQLGLYREAHQGAQEAGRRFHKLKLAYEEAKAHLYAAYASAGMHDAKIARREAVRAEALFRGLRHRGFLGAVKLLQLDLADTGEPNGASRLQTVRRQFSRAQLPFWDAMCDLRTAEASGQASATLPRLRRNPAVRCVPHLYAAWQVLEGDAAAAAGRRTQALTCWQRAADRLDTVRAALPPMELRTRYSRVAKLPHTRLVEAYLPTDPLLAAVWSERSRTAGVWNVGAHEAELRTAREKVGQSLTSLSARVLSLSQRLASPAQRSAGSTDSAAIPGRISHLHREVRECLLTLDRAEDTSLLTADSFAANISSQVDGHPVVQFHFSGQDIHALVHYRGEVAARRYVGGVQRLEALAERWRFCMERAILAGPGEYGPVSVVEQSVWRELGGWLWAGLEIPSTCSSVVLVPDGPLANLPWQALEHNGAAVGDRHAVVLTPSLRHHWLAQSRRPAGEEFHLFRGDAGDLPQIREELRQLACLAPGRTTVHAPATRASWPAEGDYLVWHYAGHARMQSESPIYSSLQLQDGPLFAADFQLRRCNVALVTLAACRSGEEVALPGEESTGFVRALLEMGARNVLASRWPVSDRATAVFMQRFYAELLNTSCLSISLQRAEQRTRQEFPSAYHWAAFGLYGAGSLGG